MIPAEVRFASALVCAAVFGFLACRVLLELESVIRWRRALKERAASGVNGARPLLSSGLAAFLIDLALQQTLLARSKEGGSGRRPGSRKVLGGYAERVRLAGLSGRLSDEGMGRARVLACVLGGLVGAAFGLALSVQLALICGLLGLIAGWRGLHWALGCEAGARKRLMEGHLSEALDVLCLGLRSGLSFDYALKLYCRYFPGVLAGEMERALGEWGSGLKPREQALREVAAGYDSAVFQRVVESVIRSMRFGSPLADELESLAAEARQRHRADVEEKVMKAPVKMMLPVGALILPSMLILVLGPVLLGMVGGF